jgi:hypothetical protein
MLLAPGSGPVAMKRRAGNWPTELKNSLYFPRDVCGVKKTNEMPEAGRLESLVHNAQNISQCPMYLKVLLITEYKYSVYIERVVCNAIRNVRTPACRRR